MMEVTSSVKINIGRIREMTGAAQKALELTAEELHKEVQQAQVMPRDKGALQGEGTFEDTKDSSKGIVRIVSNTPYARRLYFHPEYHFDKTKNPNAGGLWFDDWMPGGSKESFAKDTFKRIYRRLADL